MLGRWLAEDRTGVVNENVNLVFLLDLLYERIDCRAIGKIAFCRRCADHFCPRSLQRISHRLTDATVGTSNKSRLACQIIGYHLYLPLLYC